MADPVNMLSPVENLAKSALTAGISASDTSFAVTYGDGAKFPNPSTEGAFYATIYNSTNYTDPADDSDAEIVLVTARSGDTFTVTRGQEGTSAVAHNNVTKIYKIIQGFVQQQYEDIQVMANFDMARQAVINGNFDIAQRGTSSTSVSNAVYALDRWYIIADADSGSLPTITHSQQTLDPGAVEKSYNYARINTDGAGSTLGDDSICQFYQKIEYGTRFFGGAQQVTVTFYAKSSITGKKLGVRLSQNYGTTGSPSSEEALGGTYFELETSWTRYSYTFTTNTLSGKTFGTDLNDHLRLLFGIQWGVNNASLFGDTVATDYGGSGNVDITQVQLSLGSRPMDYSPRTIEHELQLCKRYYQKSYDLTVDPGTATTTGYGLVGIAVGTDDVFSSVNYSEMRDTPTVTLYHSDGTSGAVGKTSANTKVTSAVAGQIGTNNFGTITKASGFTAADAVVAHYTLNAEL